MLTHRSSPQARITLMAFLCLVVAPVGLALAGPAHLQTSELLTNPGFEPPFNEQGVSRIASGWTAWWITPDGATFPTSCPEDSPPGCVPYQIPAFSNTQPQNPRDPARALSGDSQAWGSTFTVFVGGVYQRVTGIAPGTRLRFSVSMMAFNCSSQQVCYGSPEGYGRSDLASDNHLRIGIDPNGGTDPFSASVVWSPMQNPVDVYAPFAVEAVAQADAVTVFTYAAPQHPAQFNIAYADNASLVAAGQAPAPTVGATQPPVTLPAGTTTYTVKEGDTLSGIAVQFGIPLEQLLALNNLTTDSIIQVGQVLIVSGAAATSAPTQIPLPTATPSAAVSGTSLTYVVQSGDSLFGVALKFNLTLDQLLALNPGLTRDSPLQVGQTIVVGVATPTPTEAPTATPASAAGGLCLIAFDDDNGDGRRDSDEPPVAGVLFEVIDGNGNSLARNTSAASDEPYCLSDLAAGRYTVNITSPSDRLPTTETSVLIGLLAGETFNVDFGSRAALTPTPPPVETPTPTATAQAETPRADNAPLAVLGIVLIIAAGLALGFALRARRR